MGKAISSYSNIENISTEERTIVISPLSKTQMLRQKRVLIFPMKT